MTEFLAVWGAVLSTILFFMNRVESRYKLKSRLRIRANESPPEFAVELDVRTLLRGP